MNFLIEKIDQEKAAVTFENFSEAISLLNSEGDIVNTEGLSFLEEICKTLLSELPWIDKDQELRNDIEFTIHLPQAKNVFYSMKQHLLDLVSWFNNPENELFCWLDDNSKMQYKSYATLKWNSRLPEYTGDILFSWEYIFKG